MKLRNKKTGEIVDDVQYRNYSLSDGFGFRMNGKEWEYHSLAELNEEWEDVEEPKEYWYVSCDGRALKATTDEDDYNKKHIAGHREIGNYFETEEEAEKALEKLKAWQRLKRAGLKFSHWDGYVNAGDSIESGDHFDCCGFVNAYGQICNSQDSYEQYRNDLDLLFGGEE